MFVTVEGASLHMEVRGPDDAPPVLFVHGYPLTHAMWTRVVGLLPGRCRCLTPDLRGLGQSQPSARAGIGRHADDLAALLDAARATRPVVLVGLSMGVVIAFEFFRRHRARLRALVLANGRATPETAEGARKRRDTAELVRRRGSRVAADLMTPMVLGRSAGPALRAELHAMMSSSSTVGVAAGALALAERPDSTPTLAAIDVPTLLIAGDEDAVTPPAMMRDMAERIPGSTLVRIPGAGHVTPMEAPGSFATALEHFLAGLR
ncbi:MAG: alpha/beta hydrolase [Phycisphaerae bacterium]|nr:alpha/beta hydrolase [Phycisphaerae bacterium]